MKNRFPILLAALLLLAALTACGSSRSADGVSYSAAAYGNADDYYYEAPAAMAYAEEADFDFGYWAEESVPEPAPQPNAPADMGDVKMIYTAYVEMESTEFDEAVSAVAALTAECGGYFESSSMSDRGSSRSATYTVRVPAAQYRAFLDKTGTVCHVTYQEESSEDVSETYYDVAGRLETQQGMIVYPSWVTVPSRSRFIVTCTIAVSGSLGAELPPKQKLPILYRMRPPLYSSIGCRQCG